MRKSKEKRLRRLLEDLAEHLEDEEAVETPGLFRAWSSEVRYRKGQRVRYDGKLYRCLMEHQALPGWNPAAAPGLWARVLPGARCREEEA